MVVIDNNRGNKLFVPTEKAEYSKHIFELYENFNKETFDSNVKCNKRFKNTIDLVYRAHEQSYSEIEHVYLPCADITGDRKVCLGFSAGLDSMYQAFELRDEGFEVVLFHVKGINTYENGQGTKHSKAFAEKFGFEYVEGSIQKTNDKSNIYKQYWPENPIKNQLIVAMMLDWCIENDCGLISLGDDFNLSIDDAVVGINLTDARELTHAFLLDISCFVKPFAFVSIEKGIDKSKRLSLLKERGAIDSYYSCVLPGRFNQSRHFFNQEKYGVNLPANNCGCSCRKCAMHNLIMYYEKMVDYPSEFIDACWRVMWDNKHSADYKFFAPDLPLEDRINNLYTY